MEPFKSYFITPHPSPTLLFTASKSDLKQLSYVVTLKVCYTYTHTPSLIISLLWPGHRVPYMLTKYLHTPTGFSAGVPLFLHKCSIVEYSSVIYTYSNHLSRFSLLYVIFSKIISLYELIFSPFTEYDQTASHSYLNLQD